MSRSQSVKPFDLIVIGSGMGGLTVASLMAQLKGWRVLVLERHFRLGGFTHSFTRPGHRAWNVGLHYVGGMHPGEMTREICDLITARAVQWQPMPSPFEKFVYPDFTFEVPDNERQYREALIARYPAEQDTITHYFKALRAATGWLTTQMSSPMLPAPIAAAIRLASGRNQSLALSTTAAYLDRHFRDPRLRALLASQWGDYGLPPSQSAFAIHALVTSSYLNGASYPVGGAGTIAKSVAEIVIASGGECLVNHEAAEIVLSGNNAVGVRRGEWQVSGCWKNLPGACPLWCRMPGLHHLLPPAPREHVDPLQG